MNIRENEGLYFLRLCFTRNQATESVLVLIQWCQFDTV